MSSPLRVLVAGCGNMGASHARAYHKMPEFEIAGLVSRGPGSRGRLSAELGGLPEFSEYYEALAATKPEQAFLLRAIRETWILSDHMHDAVNSLRIVLAADESVHTAQVVTL